MRLSPEKLVQIIDLNKKTKKRHDVHNFSLSSEQEELLV